MILSADPPARGGSGATGTVDAANIGRAVCVTGSFAGAAGARPARAVARRLLSVLDGSLRARRWPLGHRPPPLRRLGLWPGGVLCGGVVATGRPLGERVLRTLPCVCFNSHLGTRHWQVPV